MSNIFIGLKKTCLGILETEECERDNETGLKEGVGIKISTTLLPLRDARSFALYLPVSPQSSEQIVQSVASH